MKILVISLAGIGDTLFATPLIHELRANFSDARIDALVLWAGAKDLLTGNPHLNSILQKNLLKVGRMDSLGFLWGLRRQKYDLSLNTHPQSRVHYRAVARLINARTRVSHRYHGPVALDRWLIHRSLPQDYNRHAVENNLALLKLIGAKPVQPEHHYEVYLSPDEERWAQEFVARNSLGLRRRLGIHVGSGGTKNLALRRWPLGYYLELIQQLKQSHPDLAVILLGGPEEEKDHEHILAQTPRDQVFVARTRGLRDAAALLKKCDLFLSVDTALMHVAAAMKVPHQFVIETPTWNKPIEPYHQPFTLIRNPAVAGRNLEFYRYDGRGIQGTAEELTACMRSVRVEEVARRLETALGDSASGPAYGQRA